MSKARLLIVDDDWFIASVLERILVGAEYEVCSVLDGPTALERLEQDPGFEVVLLDRQMPGMDGLEVLRRMKANPALRDIPVVFQTVLGNEGEIREGMQAGALYYLVKPVEARLVLQVVAAATEKYAVNRRLWTEMEGMHNAIGLVRSGVFAFQTLQQCHDLAALLAKVGPDPKQLVVGLSELMINALEHGNLGISYDEKSALIEADGWATEVDRRQLLPENAAKWVEVTLNRSLSSTTFRIEDMGEGFDWEDFQEPNPERLFDSHGRGILMAKWKTFDRVTYAGNGQVVIAELDHTGATRNLA